MPFSFQFRLDSAIKKAEQIEKLAHSVKSKMKQFFLSYFGAGIPFSRRTMICKNIHGGSDPAVTQWASAHSPFSFTRTISVVVRPAFLN
jgi:hypothetical protein